MSPLFRPLLLLAVAAPSAVFSFAPPPIVRGPVHAGDRPIGHVGRARPALSESIRLDTTLSDDRVDLLFAWVSRAFAGDRRYNDLSIALAAIFGDIGEGTPLARMARDALDMLPPEEKAVGAPLGLTEREYASLGAMGAGQWTGQWRTRPHSLLTVSNMTSVDEWVKPLPRGVRRTLKKANAQNFTVAALPIRGDEPAPHSSLAHFRCVVEHEVRLIAAESNPYSFFDALSEAVSRYMGTTRMAGEIREYRDADGKVIAFAHEVRKGKTIRGQWFYATDQAAKSYVWFHSVYDLVRRAIEADGVDVVDLGPSGSDAFTELKERYGFVSVVDWPQVADYLGPFHYEDGENNSKEGLSLLEAIEGLNSRDN